MSVVVDAGPADTIDSRKLSVLLLADLRGTRIKGCALIVYILRENIFEMGLVFGTCGACE